jgi:hypothetical protein
MPKIKKAGGISRFLDALFYRNSVTENERCFEEKSCLGRWVGLTLTPCVAIEKNSTVLVAFFGSVVKHRESGGKTAGLHRCVARDYLECGTWHLGDPIEWACTITP